MFCARPISWTRQFATVSLATVSLAIALLAGAEWNVRAADELALPRYQFEVGQRLTYDSNSSFKYQSGSFDNADQWQITVVGKNDDGSFRIVVSQTEGMTPNAKGSKTSARKNTQCGYADIDAAGTITQLFDSFGYRLDPRTLLPKLPANREGIATKWQAAGAFDAEIRYKVLPESNAEKLVFEAIIVRPENEIYGSQYRSVVTFDCRRGLVEQIKSTTKQTYGFNGEGAGEIKLVGVETCADDMRTKLAADAERFFPAQKAFRDATQDDNATAESLDEAAKTLEQGSAQLESDEFKQLAASLLEQFKPLREYVLKSNRERKELIGQAAHEFKTVDLDDKPHALADYRGKVVLLDFWYRGCGWCIRCMPQLKELSDHYRNRPVALLGMNTDQNVDDAKFVVEKLGLGYPQLKAEGLPKEFKVHGFPTLIVIDPHGKIRHIHSGWTPTLKADLIAKIDALLAEAK